MKTNCINGTYNLEISEDMYNALKGAIEFYSENDQDQNKVLVSEFLTADEAKESILRLSDGKEFTYSNIKELALELRKAGYGIELRNKYELSEAQVCFYNPETGEDEGEYFMLVKDIINISEFLTYYNKDYPSYFLYLDADNLQHMIWRGDEN